MSFINLLANDVWSDADILNRTEAMVRSEFSLASEGIINRKLSGAGLGMYVPTLEDQAEIGRFAVATQAAAMEGAAAKADMLLLQSAMDYERAEARLAEPVPDFPLTVTLTATNGTTSEVPNPAIAADVAERTAAQTILDTATPATLALVLLRNPPPVVELEVLP